ncbi:MAG: hypothetical protein ABF649_03715 [Bacillus sp. (in: firmicutes)]
MKSQTSVEIRKQVILARKWFVRDAAAMSLSKSLDEPVINWKKMRERKVIHSV